MFKLISWIDVYIIPKTLFFTLNRFETELLNLEVQLMLIMGSYRLNISFNGSNSDVIGQLLLLIVNRT